VATPTRRHEEVCIPSKIASDVSSRGHGPRKTLLRLNLDGMTPDERSAWVEEARVEAVLGSCKLSLKSLRSGYRCYLAFAGASCTPPPLCVPVRTHAGASWLSACAEKIEPGSSCRLPPRLETLLAWSRLFRSEGTWANYLGYVKSACMLARASIEVRPRLGEQGVSVARAR